MTQAPTRTTARQWVGQLVVASAMGASLTALYMLGNIQTAVKADMRLTDFDISLITGLAIAIPMALFGVPVGMAADRFNRIHLMLGLTVLWMAAALATAFAPTLPVLFAIRVVAAAAGSGMLTISVSLAADLSPPDHRGQAMLVSNLGKLIYSTFALLVGAGLLEVFRRGHLPGWTGLQALAPWRAAHVVMAALGAVFLGLLLLVREPARQEAVAGPSAPLKVVLAELWARRAFLGPLMIAQVGVLMADTCVTLWAVPILQRRYHLDMLQFAAPLAVVVLGAGLFGSIVGGYAADAGHKSGRKGGVMLGALIAAAIAVPTALAPLAPTGMSFIGVALIFLTCGVIAGLSLMAVVGLYLPNETRGLTFGLFMAVGGLISLGLAPMIVVLVSGLMGGEDHLAQAVAVVATVISLLAFAAFWLAMRNTPVQDAAHPPA